MATMCKKSVYEYFNKWKQLNEGFTKTGPNKIRDRILKVYMGYIR